MGKIRGPGMNPATGIPPQPPLPGPARAGASPQAPVPPASVHKGVLSPKAQKVRDILTSAMSRRNAALPPKASYPLPPPKKKLAPALAAVTFDPCGFVPNPGTPDAGPRFMGLIEALHDKTSFGNILRRATHEGAKKITIRFQNLPFTSVGLWNANESCVDINPTNPKVHDVGRMQGTVVYELINASLDPMRQEFHDMARAGELESMATLMQAILAREPDESIAQGIERQSIMMDRLIQSRFSHLGTPEELSQIAASLHKFMSTFPDACTGQELYSILMECVGWLSAKEHHRIMKEATQAGIFVQDSAKLFGDEFEPDGVPDADHPYRGLFTQLDNYYLFQKLSGHDAAANASYNLPQRLWLYGGPKIEDMAPMEVPAGGSVQERTGLNLHHLDYGNDYVMLLREGGRGLPASMPEYDMAVQRSPESGGAKDYYDPKIDYGD